jgi:hypothetical protein
MMFKTNVILYTIFQCIATSCNGTLYREMLYRNYYKTTPMCDPCTYVVKRFPGDVLAACGRECNKMTECTTFTHGI